MLAVVDADEMALNGSRIDEIVHEGTRRMLATAPEAEANGYLAELVGARNEASRRQVVRNGFRAERTKVTRGAGSRSAALAMTF